PARRQDRLAVAGGTSMTVRLVFRELEVSTMARWRRMGLPAVLMLGFLSLLGILWADRTGNVRGEPAAVVGEQKPAELYTKALVEVGPERPLTDLAGVKVGTVQGRRTTIRGSAYRYALPVGSDK